MCLLLVPAVTNRNQKHPFCCWNLTELSISVGICQWLGSMNRSNLNSHLGEGDPFWSWGWQPARDCTCVRPRKPGCAAEALQPGVPLAQLMRCTPFLASPVSFVGELYQPRMQISSLPQGDGALAWPYLSRVPKSEDSSLKPFGMDFNSF